MYPHFPIPFLSLFIYFLFFMLLILILSILLWFYGYYNTFNIPVAMKKGFSKKKNNKNRGKQVW